MNRRSARLSLEALDGRELPSAAGPDPVEHYSHIRVAELAYTGTPVGTFEKDLLKNSMDLVVPAVGLLDQIDAVAPTTPQLIYTNVSNIYLNLLTDWLNFADTHGYDHEAAFY